MVREKNPEAEALIQKGIEGERKSNSYRFCSTGGRSGSKKIGYDFSGVINLK
jgi:hypothetical protein